MSYRKLVRDKIPEIIKNTGENPITKILNDNEYKIELEKKLLEECHEVINAKTKEDRLEELADLLEVMLSLSKTQNNNLEDIIDVCKTKRLKRGGFDKKIYLIDVEK